MPIAEQPVQSHLSAELPAILRCLSCGSKLESDQNRGYLCSACNRAYPNAQGVARFVEAEHYAASFGFQWHRYQQTQLDHDEQRESERHFLAKTALRPEDLRGKLVLDVGCGMGRFAEVATRWGARVVGVDLSAAAEVAAKNLADRDFVAFQADVFALPFAPESFDVIYSIGVLHHTPDCEAAVKALDKYLKPGGLLVVWLYSGYNKWYRFSDFWRGYTHKMKPENLHRILKLAVPFFYNLNRGLRRVPLIGSPLAGLIHHMFPVNRQQNPEARMLDTFDWYSPKYQSKHTYEQVFKWYAAMGMEDMRVGEISIAVRGRKPARG
ncbi:MAG TPA: methyltransferase domain-containing protein [Terriglobales bacterium]|jgi:2-polyprenyl-3-methyl-5-hydroxy-6-metoxy-1,4-benzoquinol methylase|nr:methyltransferase domain-containing protein [Terriglobales bacterium]